MPSIATRRALPLSLLAFAFAPLLLTGAAPATAQDFLGPLPTRPTPDYYLPAGTDYDPAIPKPATVLGFEVGEWHARHDQLVEYYETLDRVSDRLRLEEIGRTYEQRRLLNLYVSSPSNLARLPELLAAHARLVDGPAEGPGAADPSAVPLVVYLGYSIHGNESSGSNAALLVAYHLAAARGPAIEALLDKTVIVLDPSLNPDGLSRFAQWANQNRGRVPVADPRTREHVEPWPSGRTNHYGFDLNRDWLLGVNPESQARLAQFRRLRPNLFADFHEMGTDGTFFFQPGVPSRQNPLTPAGNLELTRRIAEFHARALDRLGSLYYTEESFDDFYYGKGSTYPDIQGGVGILFEQASSRGHVQDSPGGPLTFPFTIRNQVTASLSMLEAAAGLRGDLLAYQRDFYRQALADAAADPRQAIVFGDAGDPQRAEELARLLLRHGIEVHRLGQAVEAEGQRYEPGAAFVVPLRQAQYRLVRAIFEKPTTFADETFYDVSAWTLPLAYGLAAAELRGKAFQPAQLGERLEGVEPAAAATGLPELGDSAVAVAFPWRGAAAARALYLLEARGIKARAATKAFAAGPAAATGKDGKAAEMGPGTIVVPLAQSPDRAGLEKALAEVAAETRIAYTVLRSGLTASGIDLGSPNLKVLKKPRPAIVVGAPYDISEVGEAWFQLDRRMAIETTLLERRDLLRADLSRYSHLIFVSADGNADLAKNEAEAVRAFARAGGVLIASGRAAVWAEKQILHPPAEGEEAAKSAAKAGGAAAADEKKKIERKPYGDFEKDAAHDLLAGAIFEVSLDLTHPLAYGYSRPLLPVFRTHTETLPLPEDPYARVAVYTDKPRLAGFTSDDNLKKIAGTPALVAERLGRGAVLLYLDDPNFRGFWRGGSQLFLNGLFFSGLIDDTKDGPGAAD